MCPSIRGALALARAQPLLISCATERREGGCTLCANHTAASIAIAVQHFEANEELPMRSYAWASSAPSAADAGRCGSLGCMLLTAALAHFRYSPKLIREQSFRRAGDVFATLVRAAVG